MIDYHSYSAENMSKLYELIEYSVQNKTNIDMSMISEIIKPGDLYLIGCSANGLVFTFDGLKWIQDDYIYGVLIQPRVISGSVYPEWYPIVSYNDRNGSSSADLSMIKKDNRYCSMLGCGWINKGQ